MPPAAGTRRSNSATHGLQPEAVTCERSRNPRPSGRGGCQSPAIRTFVGVDLSWDAAPDAATLLKFRHQLETHQLTERISVTINGHLAARGQREGTLVDATIIAPIRYKEAKRTARSGHVPDPRRQPVALRDEGAYWHGC